MESLQEKLVFMNDHEKSLFNCALDKYRKLLKAACTKDPDSRDELLKEFGKAVWSLEKHCRSTARYPVESVFKPDYDLYVLIGLWLLADLGFDAVDAVALIKYGLETGILWHRFANLMLCDLAKADNRLQEALTYAQNANAEYAHCGASYRRHYECWSACKDAGLPLTEKYEDQQQIGKKFCSYPFVYLAIRNDGCKIRLTPCCTSLWMAYAKSYDLDQITSAEDKIDFWNSSEFQEIRRSILDGDFSYCSKVRCAHLGYLQNRDQIKDKYLCNIIDNHLTELPGGPKTLVCLYDETCNLACPSCRSKPITVSRDLRSKFDSMAERFILPLITDEMDFILINGSGEALASQHSVKLLNSLDFKKHPALKIHLMTNGELLRQRLHTLGDAARHIDRLIISFDGITKETYEKIRRNGNFAVFIDNMNYAADLRKRGEINKLVAVSTIYEDNIAEIEAIYDFCDTNGFDAMTLNKLQNWGSYSYDEFLKIDVWDSKHPKHQIWKAIYASLQEKSKNGGLTLTSSNII